MNRIKTMLRTMLAVVAALQLTACSKTVQWEEEVPLNTGETIWVKRSGAYTYKSAPGNPLDFGYGPERRSTIEFDYKGKKYSHTSEAGLVLLAIDPEGKPNLIAPVNDDWGWQHNYYCVTPYYVQFRSDETGKHWNWPEQIDHWLYNLPVNLVIGLVPLESDRKKFRQHDREQKNASLLVFKHLQHIDPTHSISTCPRRK